MTVWLLYLSLYLVAVAVAWKLLFEFFVNDWLREFGTMTRRDRNRALGLAMYASLIPPVAVLVMGMLWFTSDRPRRDPQRGNEIVRRRKDSDHE